MTSPVSAIEAIEKTPNRIQGMVRSIDQYRNGDPKAVADGSYAQVLFALQDMRNDILALWDFAVSAARQAEALQRDLAQLITLKDIHAAKRCEYFDRFQKLERENAELREALKEIGTKGRTTGYGKSALAVIADRALLGGENAE